MRHRSIIAVMLAFLVVAAACNGDSGDPEPTELQTSVTPGTDVDLREALSDAGVTIIDDPASAPAMDGLQLWSWQVENLEAELEAGGGYLGTQLDDLAGSPGGLPFSYLVAGWMKSAVSPSAVAAAEMMGDQPLDQAPSLGYPTAVLVLFVADAVQIALEDQPQAAASAVLASSAQSRICSTLAGWVNTALDFVFNALKVDVEGSGFFSWLGTIWNSAVDLARDAVVGVIKTLTKPVVSLIKDALAVVGVVSMAGSLLSRWFIDVEPSTPSFLLPGPDEPRREETFTATVDTKIDFEWDDYIVDCADVAGLDLPDPSEAAGSRVRWEVSGFPQFGTTTDSADAIDSNNQATLEWESARDETREGDTRTGWVWAHATVVNNQYDNLKSMVWSWISGKISGFPLEEQVKKGIAALVEPILDKIVKLVEFRGQGGVGVVYHLGAEPLTPTVTILDPDTGCEVETPDEVDEWHELEYDDFPPHAEPDSVPYSVRIDGVTAEQAEDLKLKVSAEELGVFVDSAVDGSATVESKIEPIPLTEGRQISDDSWLFQGTVPLGYVIFISDALEVWAWIDLPGGGNSSDTEIFTAALDDSRDGEPSDDCIDTDDITIDFRYLEQRHNVWVQARVRVDGVGGSTTIDEHEVNLVSLDEDPTMQSTIREDGGDPQPIEPRGLMGYMKALEASAQAGSIGAAADASLDFQTTVSTSRVRITGLYEHALVGNATSDDGDATSIALASSGVLFTFSGRPMDVVVAWNCDLEVGLMELEDRQRKEVLIDNNAEDCSGRFEGTLKPDTTYQLLASVGIFGERYANDGKVFTAAGEVLRDDTAAYNVAEGGDFRLILTPAG